MAIKTYVYPKLAAQVSTSGLATEAKQDVIISELGTLNSTDFATEAKQDSQILEAQNTVTELQTLNATDFATSAKQDASKAVLDQIELNQDSQESILTQIELNQDASKAVLDQIELNQDAQTMELGEIKQDVLALNQKVAASLVPEKFDHQSITYVAAGNGAGEVETITYKLGGSGGVVVAVITLGYDAQNRVNSVTRS